MFASREWQKTADQKNIGSFFNPIQVGILNSILEVLASSSWRTFHVPPTSTHLTKSSMASADDAQNVHNARAYCGPPRGGHDTAIKFFYPVFLAIPTGSRGLAMQTRTQSLWIMSCGHGRAQLLVFDAQFKYAQPKGREAIPPANENAKETELHKGPVSSGDSAAWRAGFYCRSIELRHTNDHQARPGIPPGRPQGHPVGDASRSGTNRLRLTSDDVCNRRRACLLLYIEHRLSKIVLSPDRTRPTSDRCVFQPGWHGR